MTHLVRTLLAIGLAASPAARAAGRAQRPPEELPKAPVMIVLPADAAPRGSVAKKTAPRPPKGAEVPRGQSARATAPAAPPVVVVGPPVVTMAPRVGAAGPTVGMMAPVPPERRPGFGLVAQKCGRCHGVEKALNAGFSPDEWDGYLKKKYRRAGAGITEEQAAEIGGFLKGLAAHRDGG